MVATVNYATEKARVTVDAAAGIVDSASLVAAVESAGYTARLPQPVESRRRPGHRPGPRARPGGPAAVAADRLCRRSSIPVIAMAMVPAAVHLWQWLSLTLAAPVVVWGAWPFHRAAWTNLRHGAATMDTLVSIGTLAASAGRCTPSSSARPARPG